MRILLSFLGLCGLFTSASSAVLVDISFAATAIGLNGASAATFPTPNQTYVFSNAGTVGSTPFDAVLQFTSFRNSSGGLTLRPFGDMTNGGSLGFDLNGRASSSQHAYFNIRIVESGSATDANPTGTILPINQKVRIQSFDLDSNGSQNFTDVFGFRTADSAPNRIFIPAETALEQAGFQQAVASSGTLGLALADVPAANVLVNETNANYTMWRAQQVNGSWNTVGNISFTDVEAQIPYTVTFEYNTIVAPLHFVWGATGPATNQNSRGIRIDASNPLHVAIPEPRWTVPVIALFALVLVRRVRRRG